MLKLFRRRKTAPVNPLKEKAAGAVVAKILWLQNKWAQFMDKRVNGLSFRWRKIGLAVFISLSILICVSILIETFTGTHKRIQIGKMRKPVLQRDTASISIAPPHKVVAFQKYMDSLLSSPKGRRIYDSINLARPGLLDSAKLIEKLYHNQNK